MAAGDQCPGCGAAVAPDDKVCPECGLTLRSDDLDDFGDLGLEMAAQGLDPKEVAASARIHEAEERGLLRHYLVHATGISRPALNLTAGAGLVLWGLLVHYLLIARRGLPLLLYLVALMGVFGLASVIVTILAFLGEARVGRSVAIPLYLFSFASFLVEDGLIVFAGLAYAVGWIMANVSLSRYQRLARERVLELESEERLGADAVVEEGMLLHKVLRQEDAGTKILAKALRVPGGSDALLLNSAGNAMAASKRYREAEQYYERALGVAGGEALPERIKKNLAAVRKKLAAR